jgi:hypothetical protein
MNERMWLRPRENPFLNRKLFLRILEKPYIIPSKTELTAGSVCHHHDSELFNPLQAHYWLMCCNALKAADEMVNSLKGTKCWTYQISQVVEQWDEMLAAINSDFKPVMEELDVRELYNFLHGGYDGTEWEWRPVCIGNCFTAPASPPVLTNLYLVGCQLAWFCSNDLVAWRAKALMVAALLVKNRQLQIFLGESLRIQENMTHAIPESWPTGYTYCYSFSHRLDPFSHRSDQPKRRVKPERPNMWESVMRSFKSIVEGLEGVGRPLDIEIECLNGGVLSK